MPRRRARRPERQAKAPSRRPPSRCGAPRASSGTTPSAKRSGCVKSSVARTASCALPRRSEAARPSHAPAPDRGSGRRLRRAGVCPAGRGALPRGGRDHRESRDPRGARGPRSHPGRRRGRDAREAPRDREARAGERAVAAEPPTALRLAQGRRPPRASRVRRVRGAGPRPQRFEEALPRLLRGRGQTSVPSLRPLHFDPCTASASHHRRGLVQLRTPTDH